MKKSLTVKMFAITFLSFMILISSIFLFNSLYFTRVYEQRKITSIINNMNNFAKELNENDWDDFELYRQIDIFHARNNVQINIINSKEQLIYFPYYSFSDLEDKVGDLVMNDVTISNGSTYFITLKDLNDNFFDMYISTEEYKKIFYNKDPFKGDKLSISGYITDDFIINADVVNGVELEIEDYEKTSRRYNNDVYLVNIENLRLKKDSVEYLPYGSSNEIGNPAGISSDLKVSVKDKDGVKYSIESMPYTRSKQVTFIKSAVDKNGNEVALMAYASLQPVNEAVGVIKEYYVYFYILAAIISTIIAVIYSQFVTKPLIKLSQSASRMAKMDFSDNYEINKADELGLLSRSLKTMSFNLEQSLSQLKDANKQLRLDYEKEIKQEKVRKEFVANVSHELKTPLGIIKGFAEGIKDGIKKDKREYYLDVILDEIEKMNEFILEMLELSKLEAGAVKLNKEIFSLHDIVSKTSSVFELPISDKKLGVRISGKYGNVLADKSKFEQVLINLIGNAIKHSISESEIKIKGEIKGSYNYVYIENRCNPIIDEDLERIWDRFYKADKSHNRDSGGTGLGLAIVKAILEAHGCDYGVKSTNDGIVFYFAIEIRIVKD